MRQGATSVLKWFSAFYVLAIIVQLFLAGEGIFRLNNVRHSDNCDKAPGCIADSSKTLDAHRALGFFLTLPGALLFLIVALVAWHANKRTRTISILAPILAFLQTVLAAIGSWVGGLHVLNGVLVLGLFTWLAITLRQPQEAVAPEVAPAPTAA
jgi:uncharacterized membrane protein